MIKLNGEEIEISKFPNGESKILTEQIDLNMFAYKKSFTEGSFPHELVMFFESNEDLLHLVFIKNYLKEKREQAYLILPRMPYSQMDRATGGQMFTLKFVADIINSLDFEWVLLFEPHSDVTPALINRCTTMMTSLLVLEHTAKEVGFNPSRDIVLFPDAGAQKRYTTNFNRQEATYGAQQLVGFKSRNQENGEIESFQVLGVPKHTDFKAIIVDDLCMRGGTFLESAEKLKELGASEIYLAVTHCEQAIYTGDILTSDLITKVYTTNSIIQKYTHPKIEVIDGIVSFGGI